MQGKQLRDNRPHLTETIVHAVYPTRVVYECKLPVSYHHADKSVRRTYAVKHALKHDNHLSGANLRKINLQGSDLSDKVLCGVDFSGANLQGVNFGRANLHSSNFTGANVRGANFRDACLEDTNFTKARSEGSNLEGVLYDQDRTESNAFRSKQIQDVYTIEKRSWKGRVRDEFKAACRHMGI